MLRRNILLSLVATFALTAGCDGENGDERPPGPLDEHAELACSVAGAASTHLSAASTEAEASNAALTASETPYHVTLPATGQGYLVIRTEEEHVDLALFSSERGVFVSLQGTPLGESRPNGHCASTLLEDYRLHIHQVDDFLLTVSEDAPRELTLVLLRTGAGHPEADGGHHHDDDGGHHHRDDGGHHDHDGGMCAPSGGHCHDDADCCSNDCHDDHCH